MSNPEFSHEQKHRVAMAAMDDLEHLSDLWFRHLAAIHGWSRCRVTGREFVEACEFPWMTVAG